MGPVGSRFAVSARATVLKVALNGLVTAFKTAAGRTAPAAVRPGPAKVRRSGRNRTWTRDTGTASPRRKGTVGRRGRFTGSRRATHFFSGH